MTVCVLSFMDNPCQFASSRSFKTIPLLRARVISLSATNGVVFVVSLEVYDLHSKYDFRVCFEHNSIGHPLSAHSLL